MILEAKNMNISILCLSISRGCQPPSDCGSWSGPSGQPEPKLRNEKWSRKNVLQSGHHLEKKTIHTGVGMWQNYYICTCWATLLTLDRYAEGRPHLARTHLFWMTVTYLGNQIFPAREMPVGCRQIIVAPRVGRMERAAVYLDRHNSLVCPSHCNSLCESEICFFF